jgi:hypothetical protein
MPEKKPQERYKICETSPQKIVTQEAYPHWNMTTRNARAREGTKALPSEISYPSRRAQGPLRVLVV